MSTTTTAVVSELSPNTLELSNDDFLSRFWSGEIPEVPYIVHGDVQLGRGTLVSQFTNLGNGHFLNLFDFESSIFKRGFCFGNSIFSELVNFGNAEFYSQVDFSSSTFNCDLMLGNAAFMADVRVDCGQGPAFNGLVHSGRNPAIAWMIGQYHNNLAYSEEDARYMCDHPRPMIGWRRDSQGDFIKCRLYTKTDDNMTS